MNTNAFHGDPPALFTGFRFHAKILSCRKVFVNRGKRALLSILRKGFIHRVWLSAEKRAPNILMSCRQPKEKFNKA
jgi:hypothetical protein